jgi:hypothetical protein
MASGGIGTYTWSITGLPGGLTTDGNGDISGTPVIGMGSTFTVAVSVTDLALETVSKTFALTINGPLTITGPATLPVGVLNNAYTPTTITASGGLAPYTWTATGLPSGLSIAAGTGVVSGTPTADAGSPYSVTISVEDPTGKTASQNYSLTVSP